MTKRERGENEKLTRALDRTKVTESRQNSETIFFGKIIPVRCTYWFLHEILTTSHDLSDHVIVNGQVKNVLSCSNYILRTKYKLKQEEQSHEI